MKSSAIILLASIAILMGCKEPPPTSTPPDLPYTNAGYNYFPSEDGYQWEYWNTIKDENDSIIEQEKQIGVYSKPSTSINYTSDNQGRGYSVWYNYGERLLCCGSTILIDYKNLDCVEDSILIREESVTAGSRTVFIQTYQYCERKYRLVEGYEGTECIKTLQINKFDDGNKLVIERYFGFGIGLIYESQVTYDL